MVKFDAFAGGIEIGGLRSMLEIKILICYILESVKTPMTRNQICDVLQKTGLVNFFDANSALDELLEKIKDYKSEDVAVIGGASIYRQLLPYCDTAYVTFFDASFPKDTYFPNLDESGEWKLTEKSEVFSSNPETDFPKEEIKYWFAKYERITK